MRTTPNLESNIDRPLRYHPEGADFVIENGSEFFNRPLYGGNTAFRVDGGDKPEFVLYLPGRGGNLRLGIASAAGTKWLHDAARIVTRYRPGMLRYEIRDPLLGANGIVRVTALGYPQTEGLGVRVEAGQTGGGIELVWAYGGINGQRGRRDGDIGTEDVPISQWFHLRPEFANGNTIELWPAGSGQFTLWARAAKIAGVAPAGARLTIGDANKWNDIAALLGSGTGEPPVISATDEPPVPQPIVVGRVALESGRPLFLSLQRVPAVAAASTGDLATYREVGAPPPVAAPVLRPAFSGVELPQRFAEAEALFAALRTRVSVETPEPFLNAAVGALAIAADAVWDEPQQAIMHGAIAWRTKLLGWRGPYALDALGWHDRARRHFTYWAGRQNTGPVPEKIPPADESANLARNETGLHSNGDISNSHYDMNLVFVDALFRHLRWTGDVEFARQLWPVVERHLAWERRLFRRTFERDRQALPLYEAYAAIWASDDLEYGGGGAMHASAYSYWHNLEAARLARLLGRDASVYQREAQLLERGMREHLWQPERGTFAEYKDLLGLQRVHPSAGLWTFYNAMDAEVPTPIEAWQMTRAVERDLPRLPVRGPGVPAGLHLLATTNWMPYRWSINNVVMGEVAHTALGFWQAGRPEEAWRLLKSALVASMFMGITPGNVGTMTYLDVYRRESQRDFADGSGVLSRAIVEGCFGVRPDVLAGELRVTPGWPSEWASVRLRHPDFSVGFERGGATETYLIEQRFAPALKVRLRLTAHRERIETVVVNGATAPWHVIDSAVGTPQIEILATAGARSEIAVTWKGAPIERIEVKGVATRPIRRSQGEMRWIEMRMAEPAASPSAPPAAQPTKVSLPPKPQFDPVDLAPVMNDRVTRIFQNEYRSPRSPYVSLAIPKQGIGGWAGGVNATADIDDTGLRAAAARNGGRFVLPNGVPFVTPAGPGAKNIAFTSQWENYPRQVTVPLQGRARGVFLLMAGSTNPMQSRFENGEVLVAYADGSTQRLGLENPTTWWPIEQDYFIDDFQFRLDASVLPIRVDLKTGNVRMLEPRTFKGRGGRVPGGAATVLELVLDAAKELKALTVHTEANEVVIGLMAATLVR